MKIQIKQRQDCPPIPEEELARVKDLLPQAQEHKFEPTITIMGRGLRTGYLEVMPCIEVTIEQLIALGGGKSNTYYVSFIVKTGLSTEKLASVLKQNFIGAHYAFNRAVLKLAEGKNDQQKTD